MQTWLKFLITGFFVLGIHRSSVDSQHKGSSNLELWCFCYQPDLVFWTSRKVVIKMKLIDAHVTSFIKPDVTSFIKAFVKPEAVIEVSDLNMFLQSVHIASPLRRLYIYHSRFAARIGFDLGPDCRVLETIFSYLFYPFSFIMGVDIDDCRKVASLVGIKTMINEFVAYDELGKIITTTVRKASGPCLNIKTLFPRYGDPYTGKTTSLYWGDPLITETEITFWWDFRHFQHRKLSIWELSV